MREKVKVMALLLLLLLMMIIENGVLIGWGIQRAVRVDGAH